VAYKYSKQDDIAGVTYGLEVRASNLGTHKRIFSSPKFISKEREGEISSAAA